jgi:SAM-dependent methyltransferase
MAQAVVVPIAEPNLEPRGTGYVTDVPYIRSFIGSLAPALLDHVALISDFTPPARENGFTYCDLGCGQGVTTAVLASTHPGGEFHGIDFMPEHIDHARRFCGEARISNGAFHQVGFDSALKLGLPLFDYIVCHGVYAWVNEQVQRDIVAFVNAQLKPGGLLYLSYNAMPGWATELGFQKLARSLAQTLPGDSTTQMSAAVKTVRGMFGQKVPALADSFVLKMMEERPGCYPQFYLAHEYMNSDWRPLFVTEVRKATSTIGLIPVGSAKLIDNFDSFVLGARAREVLSSIADDDVRELARDYYIDQHFRCDVFIRHGHRMGAHEQRQRILDSTLALRPSKDELKYKIKTPAGSLNFDNQASRAIVAALTSGPLLLSEVHRRTALDAQDVIANALTLCAAKILMPVEKTRVRVKTVNQAIRDRLGGPEPIELLVLPWGAALAVKSDILRALARGEDPAATTSNGSDSDDNQLDFASVKAYLMQQSLEASGT